ncbi:MAG TPA: argininosuccinate lyase [Edaphobacter sp.]|nr:argininosuccinate lyase [Edaphobacter sp.]
MSEGNSNKSGQASKMWSGRFREPLDARFEAWQRSFPFDWRLFQTEVSASIAHARAIAAAGILTAEEEERMVAGLNEIGKLNLSEREMHNPDASFAASAAQAEDVHHFVELELTREIGELALKLHTGRSRNEQIATDMRLYVGDGIHIISHLMREWCLALVELAEAAGDAVMPSYTHLQRAEPVLVAHWLLSYVSMAERDISRLRDCKARLSLSPLGSGAIAGATLALDREIASRIFGFDGPTLNSMDATSDRDFAIEFTHALSIFGLHVSRFAEEITLFSTAEFGFVELPEAFSTGSSAMPQKKNPDLTELLRGKAARLFGASATLTMLLKGLPLAYNKDLQEGQEPVFEAADTVLGILEVLPAFTRALKFRFDRMRVAAESGYLNAMAAATYLSNNGVPFRKAHEIIGNAVRLGLECGRELNQLSLNELQQLSPAFAADFFDAITLEATLDCHNVVGGTARHRVAAALKDARQRISHGVAEESEKLA